jgi:hypothetical protein
MGGRILDFGHCRSLWNYISLTSWQLIELFWISKLLILNIRLESVNHVRNAGFFIIR